MDQDEWITYDVEEVLETWLQNSKPSEILETRSSEVCGIRITVPVSTDSRNNNTVELEEGFESLTSQKEDMRLVHVEEQATTLLVSTDKFLLKVNARHVDEVFRGLVMNLHYGQFGRKVYRVEVSLVADKDKMKKDFLICVYNANFTGTDQSQSSIVTEENNANFTGTDQSQSSIVTEENNANFTGTDQSQSSIVTEENNNDPVDDLIPEKSDGTRGNGIKKVVASKIDTKNVGFKKNKKEKRSKPCKFFNEGSCKFDRSHLSKSRLTRWVHICGFCFAKCVDEKPHPESHCKEKPHPESQCVNKKKAEEGSTFTLVRHNVSPTCSCSGGNKGCKSNSCACVRFSQECEPECGCGDACINMGLTRGEGKLLTIRESGVQGDGCFTEEDIWKGEYVGEYTGKLVLRGDQMKKKDPSKYLFEMGHKDILLDAENFGSELAKMNHKTEKRGANCMYQLKRAGGVWKVGVWALKNIKKGDELFANYSDNYRGHGLFTPEKKKSKKIAQLEEKEKKKSKKVAQLEEKEKFKNHDKKLKQRSALSLKTKQSESPSQAQADLSTPKRTVGGQSVSLTCVRSSPVIRDLPKPRLLRLDMDSPIKTTQNQSLNAELPNAKTMKKLSKEKAKASAKEVTKTATSSANKENVRKPNVIKETNIFNGKFRKSVPPVSPSIKPRELDNCKGMLDNSTSLRRSPRIMAMAEKEKFPLRSPDVESKNLALNSGKENVEINGEDGT